MFFSELTSLLVMRILYRSIALSLPALLMVRGSVSATTVVAVDAQGHSHIEQSSNSLSSSLGTGDGTTGKDIVSNVMKAIQISTQENLFLANIFTVASKISNLSLEATNTAIHIHVLKAYVELLVKTLDLTQLHRIKDSDFTKLINQALAHAKEIMTQSPTQSS